MSLLEEQCQFLFSLTDMLGISVTLTEVSFKHALYDGVILPSELQGLRVTLTRFYLNNASNIFLLSVHVTRGGKGSSYFLIFFVVCFCPISVLLFLD